MEGQCLCGTKNLPAELIGFCFIFSFFVSIGVLLLQCTIQSNFGRIIGRFYITPACKGLVCGDYIFFCFRG